MSNIDRAAEEFCTNPCEGFFGVVVKYTEGKRRYLPKNLSNIVALAACNVKNDDAGDRVLKMLGVDPHTISCRRHYLLAYKRKIEKFAQERRKEEPKAKRTMRKIDTMDRCLKAQKSPSAHKSGKMEAAENCKAISSNRKRKGSKTCSNCGCIGHTIAKCDRADFSCNKRRKVKKVIETEQFLSLFRCCQTTREKRRDATSKDDFISLFKNT